MDLTSFHPADAGPRLGREGTPGFVPCGDYAVASPFSLPDRRTGFAVELRRVKEGEGENRWGEYFDSGGLPPRRIN